MNRLTGRLHDNWVYLLGSTRQNTKEFNLDNRIAIAMQKLAAYEDTGLEPEKIQQLNDAFINSQKKLEKTFDELFKYKDLEEQLLDKYNELKNKIDGDGVENYTNGYKYGHRNGQIELLEWILKIDTGYREEAEKVLEVENE